MTRMPTSLLSIRSPRLTSRHSCHSLGPGVVLEVKSLTSSSFFAVSNASLAPVKVHFTIRGTGYRALGFCPGAAFGAPPSPHPAAAAAAGPAAAPSGDSSTYEHVGRVPKGRSAMVCAIVADADAMSVFFECEADVWGGDGVGSEGRPRDGRMSMALGEEEKRDVLRKTAGVRGMGVVASGNLLVVNQGME